MAVNTPPRSDRFPLALPSTGSASLSRGLNYLAFSIQIDNPTNAWIYDGNGNPLSGPQLTGVVVALQFGVQTAQATINIVPPSGSQSLQNLGGTATLTWTSEKLAAQPGTAIAPANVQQPLTILINQHSPANQTVALPPNTQSLIMAINPATDLSITVTGHQTGIQYTSTSLTNSTPVVFDVMGLADSSLDFAFSGAVGNPLFLCIARPSPADQVTITGTVNAEITGILVPGNPVAVQLAYEFGGTSPGGLVLATDRAIDSWAVVNDAGNGTAASATEAAPGVGKKLVVTTITATVSWNGALPPSPQVYQVELKDGSGTQKWTARLLAASNTGVFPGHISLTDLRIPSSAPNQSMTLDFTGSQAGDVQNVALSGFIASSINS